MLPDASCDHMSSVPTMPQNISASASGTQAISVSWRPVKDIKGSKTMYYIGLMGQQTALSLYENYTWNGLSPDRTYIISVRHLL